MPKVLVIDNQYDTLKTIEDILEIMIPDCKVIRALSGEDGIVKARKEKPDVIILDIVMPEIDGFEVCQRLIKNQKTKHIPIILITELKTELENRIKGLELSAEAFLHMPINESELVAQTKVMLRLKTAEDELRADKLNIEELVLERTKELIEINTKLQLEITKRNQTEAALCESEEKFRLLTEQNILGLVIIQDGFVKYVNQATSNITEYPVDEVLNWEKNGFGKLIHSNDLKFVMEQASKKQAGEKDVVTHYSYRLITKSGKVKWVDQYSKTITFEGENADFVNLIDITERKQAENQLKASEEKFHAYIENSPIGIFIADEEGNYRDCNRTAHELLDYTREEILKMSIPEIIPDENAEIGVQSFLTLKEKGYINIEVKLLRKNRTTVPVILEAVRLPDNKFIAYCTDNTERKHAGEALRESEQRYRALFENESDAIIILDAITHKFEDANSATLKLYGYTRKEFLAIKVEDISAEPEETLAMITKMLKSDAEPIRKTEGYHKKKDGTIFPVEISPGVFSIGGRRKVFGAVRDISESKKYEEELKKSQRQFRLLSQHQQQKLEEERKRISRQVHDGLGQDLIALKIDITNLKEQLIDNKMQINNNLKHILKRTNLMIQIVKQISTDLRPGILDHLGLAAAIEWYADDFQIRSGVKCRVNIKPDEIDLKETVAVELYRILQEALTNVMRHSQAKNVLINLTMNSKSLRLTIHDNGIGFDEKQLDYSKSLGLLGIQERARIINAKLELSSTTRKGTIIKVTLPVKYCKDG